MLKELKRSLTHQREVVRVKMVQTNIQIYKCPKCGAKQIALIARYNCKKCGFNPIDFISRQFVKDIDIIELIKKRKKE